MVDPLSLRAIASRIEAGELLSLEERLLLVAYQSGQLQLGKRAVNIGGNADSAVVLTGDGNSVQIKDIETIAIVLRTILQEHLSTPQPSTTIGQRRTSLQSAPTFPLYLPSASFAFEVVTVNEQGQASQPEQAYAQQWIEDLGKGIHLEMVAIPGGHFLMGSLDTEPGHSPSEAPQHQVALLDFWMSKYPITQAQWKAVTALPQVNRALKAKPSKFKGDNMLVEGISWYDAVEFCDRLVQQTNHPYRLPSEAEWEYACRAGTITSFHFGQTLSPQLANYNNDSVSRLKQKNQPQNRTTPVGSYKLANAFGLYDMHGNIWEWCLDCWHNNYDDALEDGSVRTDRGDNHPRVIRGGSWFDPSSSCRSATRASADPEIGSSTIGFRVVLVLS